MTIKLPKQFLWQAIVFIPALALAQQPGLSGGKKGQALIDSLLVELPKSKNDTNRVNLLGSLSFSYSTLNTMEGLNFGQQQLELAEKLHWQKGIANANNNLGVNRYNKSDYPEALLFYQKASTIYSQLDKKDAAAICLRNIGKVYSKLSDYPEALKYYRQSLAEFKETGNKLGVSSVLSSIGNIYQNLSEYNKALEYYEQSTMIAKEIGSKSSVAVNLNNMGISYEHLSNYPKALEYYQLSLNMTDPNNKPSLGSAYNNIGNIYHHLSDNPKSLEYYQKALTIFEQLGNKSGIADNYTNIGMLYDGLGDIPQSLEYFQKALDLNQQLGRKTHAADNLGCIGNCYAAFSDFQKALDYSKQALAINDQLGNNSGKADNLASLAVIYAGMSDHISALEFYKKALSLNVEIGNKNGEAFCLIGIGNVYRMAPVASCEKLGIDASNKSALSMDYSVRALQLAKEIGALDVERDAWFDLSETFEQQHEYAKSFEAYKKYILLRDSIDNADKQNQITRLQMQFDFDKKETAFRFDKQLSEEKLLRQEKELHLKQQALELTQKEKDIQQLAYLKTQAELETEQSKTQEKEKALTIAEQQQQLQTTALKLQQSQLDLKNKELRAKKLERNLYLMAAFMIVSAGSYSFYRFRKRKLIENQQALLKERLRLSRDLHDDIGSTLSSINVYSAVAMGKLKKQQTTEVEEVLQKMGVASRIMAERMSDIVWSTHPENDRLENITDRMKTFASMMFNNYGISCTFETEGAIKTASLSIEQRKNFFLIFKEAIHNIVKYAGCKNVLIRVSFHQGVLNLLIKDDGKGFDTQGIQTENMGGNGIKNMKARAEALNGVLDIHSENNKGAIVSLSMKIGGRPVYRSVPCK